MRESEFSRLCEEDDTDIVLALAASSCPKIIGS